MKSHTSFLYIFIIVFPAITVSQSLQENLEKYWFYRERLKTDFMFNIEDPFYHQGSNLIAENLLLEEDSLCELEGFDNTVLRWADGTWWLGHYLGALALEYKLLKDNGQDTNEVIEDIHNVLETIK